MVNANWGRERVKEGWSEKVQGFQREKPDGKEDYVNPPN